MDKQLVKRIEKKIPSGYSHKIVEDRLLVFKNVGNFSNLDKIQEKMLKFQKSLNLELVGSGMNFLTNVYDWAFKIG